MTFPSSLQEVEPLISCAVVVVILAACASWTHTVRCVGCLGDAGGTFFRKWKNLLWADGILDDPGGTDLPGCEAA